MADVESFFKKKIAGLPAGVWLLIIVAGVGVGLYVRNKAVDTQVDDAEDTEGDPTEADIVPIDALPSEDPGYYPLTGGGPPSVFGGGAIRLTPETLRIKLIYPKKKKRKRGGRGGGGGGGGSNRRMDGGPVIRSRRRNGPRVQVNAHDSVA